MNGRAMLDLQIDDYIIATCQVVDKAEKLQKRAESIAVGLTVGSWTDLPLAKQAKVQRHCGVIHDVQVLEQQADGQVLAHIVIAYPSINFTLTISSILTTVFGKLSMDGQIRLVELQIPDAFTRQFPGPKLGVSGIRHQLGVEHRPFIMSIFKSCIGNDLDELADHFKEQALGGVDFIKDDEIFFTEAYATPEQRVARYHQVAVDVAQTTGRQTRYAVNLTGPLPRLFERAKRLVDLGAGALLLNVFAYGFDVLQALAEDADIRVPILVHPAVSGALYGSSTHGIAADIILGQLLRLAGADMVIYPSMYGSVTLPEAESHRLVHALRVNNGLQPVLPAPSAGIYPGLVPKLVRDLGVDCVINAGGGIHGHPDGATAGGKAFVAAVDAVMHDISLEQAAIHSPELQKAIDVWGTPS